MQRRLLHLADLGGSLDTCSGYTSTADHGGLRHQLMQQSRAASATSSAVESGDAGNVAARPVEAGDQTVLDRIAAGLEHDRNRRGRRLGGKGRSGAARSQR